MSESVWEQVGEHESRMVVPGGWIYAVWSRGTPAICFVPDPKVSL